MCQHGHLKEELTQAIRTPKSRAVVHLNCWYIVSMVIVYVFSLFVVRRLFCLDFYNRLDPINARRLRPQGLRGGGKGTGKCFSWDQGNRGKLILRKPGRHRQNLETNTNCGTFSSFLAEQGNPERVPRFVGTALGQYCLQRILTDDKSHQ